MKVVFDTNVFVSALTLPDGRGDQALRKIVEGEDSLALSKRILDELLSVLACKSRTMFGALQKSSCLIRLFWWTAANPIRSSTSYAFRCRPLARPTSMNGSRIESRVVRT